MTDLEFKSTPEARALLRGMAQELKIWYRALGRNLTREEAMMEIERHFGDRLMKELCIPNNLAWGACLIIARDVALEPNGGVP